MLFFVLNMSAKKRGKVQPLGHFFGLALEKNCDFALFCQKIEINRDLVEMLQNFIDTSIKIHIDDVQSYVTFRISVDFFYFFNCEFAHFDRKNKKKSRLIRNVTKLFTSSICIFIEVSVKFRRILNKFRFILIFRPKRVKS